MLYWSISSKRMDVTFRRAGVKPAHIELYYLQEKVTFRRAGVKPPHITAVKYSWLNMVQTKPRTIPYRSVKYVFWRHIVLFCSVGLPDGLMMYNRLAKVVTSLRTKNLHKSGLVYVHATPFWVIVCMTSVKGPEIRSYALVCSFSMFYSSIV